MEDPSNAVLMERLDNLIESNSREHEEIKDQLSKTNGSVANLKLWRAYLTGAIAVLSAIVIPILFMFLSSWIKR